MIAFNRIAAATIAIITIACAGTAQAATIADSVENTNRTEANRERDGARKPVDMLGFISLGSGDVVLDYGSGGGYWSELFGTNVGPEGKVYAHQRAGGQVRIQKGSAERAIRAFR